MNLIDVLAKSYLNTREDCDLAAINTVIEFYTSGLQKQDFVDMLEVLPVVYRAFKAIEDRNQLLDETTFNLRQAISFFTQEGLISLGEHKKALLEKKAKESQLELESE